MIRTYGARRHPDIAELRPEEPARFNPDRLEELCHSIGEVRAEAEVALALHRVSEMLPRLPELLLTDAVRFSTGVEQIIEDAELIGMASLANVAQNVLDSFTRHNEVALAATLARLERVGERSILAVWDLEDLSG
ncbi:hypothetical protein [Hasllibacter sp. MH4015]|uniref:hypothetical protein n=1 Tax=Hasllibacter sp. MH4015 TaxID=2854029 RepID=UPI001CD77375|nr:hypothetical protein [Hasllibacter sp. MH4015]